MTPRFRFPGCIAVLASALLASRGASAAAPVVQPQLGKAVQNFTLQDFRGASHSLDGLKDKKVVVLAFLGTQCPIAKLYTARLVEIAKEYEARGVAVVGIDSNQQDSITELAAFARQHEVHFPLLKDAGNHVADAVGATRTPEVFVLDGLRVIRYSGRVDDRYNVGVQKTKATENDLTRALEELLAGKPVSISRVDTVGCLIGRAREPKAGAKVTYSNQIARLFQDRCVECHREGEIAPFALTNYEEAAGWADMIDEVVREQRMPPWHADPHIGKFGNDRRLSDKEKQLIHQWVADGAPQGDPAELPAPKQYVTGWQLPQAPEQVFYMREKPFQIPAEGEVKYQYFTVDPGFKEDKWVSAAQVLPGNRSVVHHIIVFVAPPGAPAGQAGRQHFTAYVPGFISEPFGPHVAKLIPKGSKLIFQVHYTPVGTPQTDRSCIGLTYAKPEEVKIQLMTNVAGNTRFAIPPHDASYMVEAMGRPYSKDVTLVSLSPHMHFRGKSFMYEAIYPNGQKETLLDVPNYDFNWQTHYNLAKPKTLPAGTRLHCVAHFDNSEKNLANPDPGKTVYWGDQTWEEMMLGYYEIAFAGEGPPEAKSNAGLVLDRGAGGDDAEGGGNRAGIDPKAMAAQFDANKDGKLSKEELPEPLQAFFDRLDLNKDGSIDASELEKIGRLGAGGGGKGAGGKPGKKKN